MLNLILPPQIGAWRSKRPSLRRGAPPEGWSSCLRSREFIRPARGAAVLTTVPLASLLVLAAGMSAAQAQRGQAVSPGAPAQALSGSAWQNDPTAKAYFDYGVRCGKGPGPGGLDLLEATSVLNAHASESPAPDDPTTNDKPVEKLLAILSTLGLAHSEAPDARQARDRFPQIREAYKLYHLLEAAPPGRQKRYLAAFEAGYAAGLGQAQQGPDQRSGQRAVERTRSRRSSGSTGTAWRKSALARQFYRFGVRCARGDAYLEDKVPALQKRYLSHLKQLPYNAPDTEQGPLGGTPEKTLRTLSVFLGAGSDLPEIRRARLQYPQMAEADRLYHLLQHASVKRQNQWAEAFQAGLTRGANELQQAEDRKMAKERAAEKRRLAAHRRLTKELLAHTSDSDLQQAIMDYVTNKIGDHWDHYYPIVARLPQPIQRVFAMNMMEGSIAGDGFEEFSDWELAPIAAAGYRLVGAPRHAELVERAAVFVPKVKQKEEDVLRAGGEPDESNKTIEALDDEFYDLGKSEDVDRLITRYIRAHLDQFIAD